MDYEVKNALEVVLTLSEEEFNYIAAAVSCGDWDRIGREAEIRAGVTGRKVSNASTQYKIWPKITEIEQKIKRK